MKAYIDIVNNVLINGKFKQPVRRNQDGTETVLANSTIALPNQVFSHNMVDGFPLLTTKRVPLRLVAVELEAFIKGITDKQWFKERNCHIWDEWANPKLVAKSSLQAIKNGEFWIKSIAQKQINDLGPIYGYQWRNFNQHYQGEEFEIEELNGVLNGTDQLKNIVDTLHNNPHDRRMVCSAWNPSQMHLMALPPCHYAWNVTVIGDELHLFWVQRSADLMLGVPFDIASYGILMHLLAKEAGLKPGNLTGVFVDCHIYENHIAGAVQQCKREPLPLPELEILHSGQKFSIFNWTHKDLKLTNYNPHDKITFGEITV